MVHLSISSPVFWLVKQVVATAEHLHLLHLSAQRGQPVTDSRCAIDKWPLTPSIEAKLKKSQLFSTDTDTISQGTPEGHILPSASLNTKATIEWPCCSEMTEKKISVDNPASTWLKFLWRNCTDLRPRRWSTVTVKLQDFRWRRRN